jgi:glutamyl-Q tRNA(Asp) synthetase
VATARHRGRFAPSPTGPLHFGSLVAAVGSYLAALHAGGEWLVRIEDLDPPREVPGSADEILATLESFGFEWTGAILRQSTRLDAYEAAIARLISIGRAYPCSCSRTELLAAQAAQVRAGLAGDELYYPGWCRDGVRSPGPTAIRFRVPPRETVFEDEIQGRISCDVAAQVGDFVVRRRDQLHAYQLAVVVDDAAQGITHVVRGVDLLNSTPRQMSLQRALGLATPKYAHLPLVTDANGIKLSKSAGAAAIDTRQPSHELWRALRSLRQEPPPELRQGRVTTLWEWAIQHWCVQPLHDLRQASIDSSGVSV